MRTLTLKLDNEEDKQLSDIMKHLGEKTANKAIRTMLKTYLRIIEEDDFSHTELCAKEHQVLSMRSTMVQFLDVIGEMKEHTKED